MSKTACEALCVCESTESDVGTSRCEEVTKQVALPLTDSFADQSLDRTYTRAQQPRLFYVHAMAPTRSGGTGKRGRPKKTAATSAPATTKQRKHAAATEKMSQKQASQHHNTASSSRTATVRQKGTRGRKRKEQNEAADEVDEIAEDAVTDSRAPKYVQLAHVTRRIPKKTIESWPIISPPILEQIHLMLRRAKDGVALSRRDPQKRAEAEDVLNIFIRRLERALSDSRIPPQARALNFDLDRLLERNEHVYQEVTTARHKNQLLEEQVESATQKLRTEETTVTEMEKNAQQWRKEWETQEKKQLHPLLQDSVDQDMVDDKPEDIGWKRPARVDTSMLDTPDSELAPLLEQLRRSLESMQGNHAQVEGIDGAVRDAQVALDDVLFKHAIAQQYDAV
ncbi:hypothetical protein K491DRAFT_194934 [Lophiostoma macrostomum CBS 122681]|uniref:Kinetochore protein fta7 n=1 Tax=Lophiostoma macrostomum CBS 122681 TaxID=1314788 RepID=A0A6A6THF4_9PLEO|nr:hypothetical protein K491DRAFT_194934 [Lophiostoma macrostomum CBS 122681]